MGPTTLIFYLCNKAVMDSELSLPIPLVPRTKLDTMRVVFMLASMVLLPSRRILWLELCAGPLPLTLYERLIIYGRHYPVCQSW